MKTLAIRLEDDLHAQLSVLAQLRNSTITDEIRLALETHLEASKSDTELTSRAQAVLDDIEREADGRRAAIATLFGTTEQPNEPATKASGKQRHLRRVETEPAND